MLRRLSALLTLLTLSCAAQSPAPDLLGDSNKRAPIDLQELKDIALQANPTIRQAEALVRQRAGLARQAGLYPNPSIGYSGEEIRGGSYDGGKQGGFVQQTIVLGGKLGLRRDVLEQQRKEDETGVIEQRYRVLSDVSQSFYAALAAQQIVSVRQRLRALAADAVTTARQLANVGQADAPDVLQAEVEAIQADLEYVNAQRKYIQMFQLLAAVAGRSDLPVCPLKGNLEQLPALDAQHTIDDIVANSPSVKRAQQDVVRAQSALASAKRESTPDLQIQAGTQNNFEPLDLAPGKAVGVHAFVTAGIMLPIFNRNQGNIAAEEADVAAAQAEVHRLQLSLRQNAQPLLQTYLSDQLQAERYKADMLPKAERAYRLYLEKYQSMAAAYPQVLVSQRTLFELEISYVHTLEELWKNAIALQNFTYSAGLTAPETGQGIASDSNLPNSGAGSAP